MTGFNLQGDVACAGVDVPHGDPTRSCGLIGIARTVSQHERALADRDTARQCTVVARQLDRAGAALNESAHTADGVGHRDVPSSVKDQLAVCVVDGHVASAQSTCTTTVADVQMTGVDGGGARIGVGPREDGGARARLCEVAGATDEVAHRDRIRAIHDQIGTTGQVHRTRAQSAVGAAVPHLQRALCHIDGPGVNAGFLTTQQHQAGTRFGHRARIPQIGHHIQAYGRGTWRHVKSGHIARGIGVDATGVGTPDGVGGATVAVEGVVRRCGAKTHHKIDLR